jgi:hypothetical protein
MIRNASVTILLLGLTLSAITAELLPENDAR